MVIVSSIKLDRQFEVGIEVEPVVTDQSRGTTVFNFVRCGVTWARDGTWSLQMSVLGFCIILGWFER